MIYDVGEDIDRPVVVNGVEPADFYDLAAVAFEIDPAFGAAVEEPSLFGDYISGVTPIASSQAPQPIKPSTDLRNICARACCASFSSSGVSTGGSQ